MSNRFYTNTGSLKGMIGLIVSTVIVTYAATHSEQIVDGTIKRVKDGAGWITDKVHVGKQQYAVCARDCSGKIYDTGRRIWK